MARERAVLVAPARVEPRAARVDDPPAGVALEGDRARRGVRQRAQQAAAVVAVFGACAVGIGDEGTAAVLVVAVVQREPVTAALDEPSGAVPAQRVRASAGLGDRDLAA